MLYLSVNYVYSVFYMYLKFNKTHDCSNDYLSSIAGLLSSLSV